ncbi:hypothetical protein SAMN04487948_102488 [Halogranum amylolyticum]|uniref:Uncharacterized protein n=1 Tax=Halogranum amylolyticum TaxID=660520 RepID=A0A1H8PU77_9EURY|nr:hypothetical protein SAMN04487948_102488 [Halogranum amylolyticum]
MTSTRRTLLTRIGLATSGAVALAGCSGLSGDDSDGGGDSAAGDTPSASTTSTESGGSDVDTSSYESEVENTLQGAVELVSHGASVDDGSLRVEASVRVTDADAVDGDIYLRSDVSYSQITVGNDVDILSEYESGQSYDLAAQFPDVDPAKVKKYTVTLEAVPNEQPQN